MRREASLSLEAGPRRSICVVDSRCISRYRTTSCGPAGRAAACSRHACFSGSCFVQVHVGIKLVRRRTSCLLRLFRWCPLRSFLRQSSWRLPRRALPMSVAHARYTEQRVEYVCLCTARVWFRTQGVARFLVFKSSALNLSSRSLTPFLFCFGDHAEVDVRSPRTADGSSGATPR